MYHTHCHTGVDFDNLDGDEGVGGVFMARQE